jgi:hypothetical protein
MSKLLAVQQHGLAVLARDQPEQMRLQCREVVS